MLQEELQNLLYVKYDTFEGPDCMYLGRWKKYEKIPTKGKICKVRKISISKTCAKSNELLITIYDRDLAGPFIEYD